MVVDDLTGRAERGAQPFDLQLQRVARGRRLFTQPFQQPVGRRRPALPHQQGGQDDPLRPRPDRHRPAVADHLERAQDPVVERSPANHRPIVPGPSATAM